MNDASWGSEAEMSMVDRLIRRAYRYRGGRKARSALRRLQHLKRTRYPWAFVGRRIAAFAGPHLLLLLTIGEEWLNAGHE